MSKNVFSTEEVMLLLTDWNNEYTVKKTYGSITFVELRKQFSLADFSAAGKLIQRLNKYYSYLNFEWNHEDSNLHMTIGIKKENIPSFLVFKDTLRQCEYSWVESGVISA